MARLFVLIAAICCTFFYATGAVALTSYRDLLNRPRPVASRTIAYGAAPQQQGELFLPAGAGPHPVVILIHGGCWLAELPGPELMDYIALALERRGHAVWNIGYRRLGEAGGGYPGTFLDVASAIDALRGLAPANGLDLKRVVVVGHSAGGQLALWAAARAHLPRSSALYRGDPLRLHGAVSLAGIDDLEAYRTHGPAACGGPQTIDRLVGPATGAHRRVYADTSPARLLPIGISYAVISGDADEIVPRTFGEAFATKARAMHDTVREVEIPSAGHFDLIDPQSAAWPRIAAEIDALSR